MRTGWVVGVTATGRLPCTGAAGRSLELAAAAGAGAGPAAAGLSAEGAFSALAAAIAAAVRRGARGRGSGLPSMLGFASTLLLSFGILLSVSDTGYPRGAPLSYRRKGGCVPRETRSRTGLSPADVANLTPAAGWRKAFTLTQVGAATPLLCRVHRIVRVVVAGARRLGAAARGASQVPADLKFQTMLQARIR